VEAKKLNSLDMPLVLYEFLFDFVLMNMSLLTIVFCPSSTPEGHVRQANKSHGHLDTPFTE
jgi:hypothetical protein